MSVRQAIRASLRSIINDGDTIAVVRVGGTVKCKQVEIVIVDDGKPRFITALVCGLLDLHRGGRDRNGGLRLSSYGTPQDLAKDIQDALGFDQLNFITY